VPALLSIWVLLVVASPGATPSALADSGPVLNILTPAPANAQAEGPVTTNITIQAQGATPGDGFHLGYAQKYTGCSAGFTDLSSPPLTVQAQGDGTFLTTFGWPVDVNSVGTAFYICAIDTTTSGTTIQSTQTFLVDSAQPPTIAVTPGTGPSSGTPTVAPSGFVPSGQINIEGQTFPPAGRTLLALLLKNKARAPTDYAAPVATVLTSTDQTTTTFVSGAQGNFTVTVVLPARVAAGRYFIYVITSDGTPSTLPSLVAFQQITILRPAPTPTATRSPTATPLPKGGTSGTGTQPFGTKRIAAILGLGGLSVLLFVLGVIFLASAAALPRPER
jgi:hypothetical protein